MIMRISAMVSGKSRRTSSAVAIVGKAKPASETKNTAFCTAPAGIELKPRELFALCLIENDRRMSGYDLRLLRPVTVPALIRFALRWMKQK